MLEETQVVEMQLTKEQLHNLTWSEFMEMVLQNIYYEEMKKEDRWFYGI